MKSILLIATLTIVSINSFASDLSAAQKIFSSGLPTVVCGLAEIGDNSTTPTINQNIQTVTAGVPYAIQGTPAMAANSYTLACVVVVKK